MHSILISYEVFCGRIDFIGVEIAHSLHELLLVRLDFWEFTKRSLVHGWIRLLCLVERWDVRLHVAICSLVKVALSDFTSDVDTSFLAELGQPV